jgi:hypothetical protein
MLVIGRWSLVVGHFRFGLKFTIKQEIFITTLNPEEPSTLSRLISDFSRLDEDGFIIRVTGLNS